MNNTDDDLGFVRRYAGVLRPEAVLAAVARAGKATRSARAMDAAPNAARPVRPVPPLRPQQSPSHPVLVQRRYATRADLVLRSVTPVPDADPLLSPDDERRAVQLSRDEDEDKGAMDELRALATKCRRHSRSRARDTRPVSDLEFYQQCAAESTQLS